MWGANRTGRPFTGDHAGHLLFETLLKFGLAEGVYRERPDDGLRLDGCVILNSVKCLPPQNKPLPAEVATCRRYYEAALALLPNVRVLVALGRIAHDNAVRTRGRRGSSAFPFGHLAEHRLPDGRILIDSYHCSRYNQNTGRLTAAMFEAVFARALELRALNDARLDSRRAPARTGLSMPATLGRRAAGDWRRACRPCMIRARPQAGCRRLAVVAGRVGDRDGALLRSSAATARPQMRCR